MAQVAEAVFRAFAPRKLNYELLGNSEAHLHWHLFPRYADDPNPLWPVWNNEAFMQASPQSPRGHGASPGSSRARGKHDGRTQAEVTLRPLRGFMYHARCYGHLTKAPT